MKSIFDPAQKDIKKKKHTHFKFPLKIVKELWQDLVSRSDSKFSQ